MSIKAITLNYFRENRLTRDICPGVRTEDLVLCRLYRDPCQHLVSGVKVEYISTVTGQALLARLHVCDAAFDSPLLYTEHGSPEHEAAVKAATYPTLQELALFYREQAQESPERAQEVQAMREHIARLRHIPRRATDDVQGDLISKWCEQRILELNPNRQLTTRQLEHQFNKTKQELLQLRREIKQIEENIQPLRDALYARESCLKDLAAELRVRPDGTLNLEAANKQINPSGLYRVRTA
jgi:hypothetical protein